MTLDEFKKRLSKVADVLNKNTGRYPCIRINFDPLCGFMIDPGLCLNWIFAHPNLEDAFIQFEIWATNYKPDRKVKVIFNGEILE